MFDVIFLKSIILVGRVLQFLIPLAGLIYDNYQESKSGGFVALTLGDYGAIKTALEDKLSGQFDEEIDITGGDAIYVQH